MRSAARYSLNLMWCLAVAAGVARAQTSPPAGTLQVPSAPSHAQPVKPPVAAPRVAVHKTGSSKPPVVPPHGPTHPQKPVAAAVQPPAAVTPPIAAQTGAPAEAKAAQAEKLTDPEKPEGVAAKLPRFASLRSDDVNMRAGPGTRYRIDWVYKRRDLPVEIEREFDVWRWVRDADGIQGWVNQATLTGRRSFIVQNTDATLRSDPSDTAAAIAILKPGVIGRIRSCPTGTGWCNVQAGSYRGYLRRGQFWGAFPDEAITP